MWLLQHLWGGSTSWRYVHLPTIHAVKKDASVLICTQHRRGWKLVCGGGIYVYLGDSSGKRSWESEAPFWPFVFSLGQRTNLSVSQPVSRERTRRRSSIFWWIQEEISRERTADPEGWPQTRWSSRLVWTLMQQASCLSVGWEEFWSAELELSSSCNDQGFILEQPLLECLFSWLFMHDYNKMALKK